MKKLLPAKLLLKKLLIVLLFCIIAITSSIGFANASSSGQSSGQSSGHIGLLTVSESANNTDQGGIADLSLVVTPGSGRIFIDSFPLSKLDTQITMRFATEVACDLLNKDCSGLDFFYTITANSAIVGGPSAGAAATVLTVAVLDNQVLNNNTIMTGTIDSGNLIGPVAGVPAKAAAAQLAGYKRVLIPKWDIVNNTPDVNLTIAVIPISTLEEALQYFTGKNYSTATDAVNSSINTGEYNNLMSKITIDLCAKYGNITGDKIVFPNLANYDMNTTNASQDNFQLAINALDNNSYYSAASFCFGGNVKVDYALIKNDSNNQLKLIYAKLLGNISTFKAQLDVSSGSISTISELETYMIVAERIAETKDTLSTIDPENISAYQLAYAVERFDTAVVWSRFSKMPGQKFVMDTQFLKEACGKKLSEAEERLNYLDLYYPKTDLHDELDTAYGYYSDNEYALCIFTASKVKADSDIVLSAIFIPDTDLDRLYSEKIAAAKKTIVKQENDNVFPILGYSYYEYANTLKDTDKYSALLYAEYSLELSNLDMYFKKKDALSLPSVQIRSSNVNFYFFTLGLSSGILIAVVVFVGVYFWKFKKHGKRKR